MALGKRRQRARQSSMWVANADLPRSVGHPFYERLNRVLGEAGFDAIVEEQCAKFYADGVGGPSLPPGRYFRVPWLDYFEGLDAARGVAWRAASPGPVAERASPGRGLHRRVLSGRPTSPHGSRRRAG